MGVSEGLKHSSVVNCDQLMLVARTSLTRYVGTLPPQKVQLLRAALRIALGAD